MFMLSDHDLTLITSKFTPEVEALGDFQLRIVNSTYHEGVDIAITVPHPDYPQHRQSVATNTLCSQDWANHEIVISKNLYVSPDHRNKGIATLFHKIKNAIIQAFMADYGMPQITLLASVNATNIPQIHLLGKQRWKKIHTGANCILFAKTIKVQKPKTT